MEQELTAATTSSASPQLFITVNRRLAEFIKQQRFHQPSHSNTATSGYLQVVEAVPAMTLKDWWQQWYEQALVNGVIPVHELPEKVLNDFEAQWFFELSLQTVLAGKASKQPDETQAQESLFSSEEDWTQFSLLNISTTAKKLYQAYAMAAEYLADDWYEQEALSKESQLLLQVQAEYLKRLKQKHYWDPVIFAQQQLNWLSQLRQDLTSRAMFTELLPEKISLQGFDEIPPFVQSWLSIIETLGVNWEVVDQNLPASENVVVEKLQADEPVDEVRQAVAWAIGHFQAGQKVTEHPTGSNLSRPRIGIVAPDLQQYKTLLTVALDEQAIALGRQKLNLLAQSQQKLYNLSLGESMLQLSLVQNALLSARIFMDKSRPVTYQDWSQWLCSPYSIGNLEDRMQWDQSLRRLQWGRFQWPKLLQENEQIKWPKRLSGLKSALDSINESKIPEKLNLSEFVSAFKNCLQSIGWPGSRVLNSDEYQQKSAFEEALQAFSELIDMGRQNYTQWLKLLTRFLGEQIHQPQSLGDEPIQIMGMLEAAGQEFDVLWILGMTDGDWPRAAQPNPFLPVHLQLKHQLPRADAQRELNYAQQVTQRLLSASDKLVFSYPVNSNEQENLFSPLIETMLSASEYGNSLSGSAYKVTDYKKGGYQSIALQQLRNRQSEPLWEPDNEGEPMMTGDKAPGGTGILKAQSRCPLMAYVDYRLGANYGLQVVEETLQQHNQGTLIHRVLELFWLEFKSLKNLLSRSDESIKDYLQQIIRQVYQQALPEAQQDPLVQVEQNRVLELCWQWLDMERGREVFQVLQTEKKFEVTIAGIVFLMVVDRIDQTDQGLFVLDYKTGKASIKELFSEAGEPIRAPQLAAYLFALDQLKTLENALSPENEVAGLGYGILHSDDGVKIQALIKEQGVVGENFAKSRTLVDFSRESEKENSDFYQSQWPDLLQSLQSEVEALANEIRTGQAYMHFSKQQDLQYSSGILALRLPEVLQQQTDYELVTSGSGSE